MLLFSGFNIYAPEVVYQNNELVFYYGGWKTYDDSPNDKIYRNGAVVLSPVAPLVQINDPSLVWMDGYWLMYMTGSTSLGGELEAQGIYYATSWDGITWSQPQFLMNSYWLPSAVRKDGKVYLYANSTLGGNLVRFDMGLSGIVVEGTDYLNVSYINVDVDYQPSINLWQMMGESGNSQKIDYLYSTDGVSFTLYGTVVTADAGGSVRTPAMHPDSAFFLYYGKSPVQTGEQNTIYFVDWR